MYWLQRCKSLLKDIMLGWSEIQKFLMCSHMFISLFHFRWENYIEKYYFYFFLRE